MVLELQRRGFEVTADEELSGDGFWHVAAFSHEVVDESRLRKVFEEGRALAARFGARWDGWTWRTTLAEEKHCRSPDLEQ